MKKLAYLALSGTALLLALAACNDKDSDPTPAAPTRTSLLTSHTWKPSSGTLVYTYPSTGVTVSQDFQACQKDDSYKFGTDKTLVFNEGTTKCDQLDPQQDTGTWAFSNGDQKLTMNLASQDPLLNNLDIKEFSASTLHVTGAGNTTDANGDPATYTIDATFVPQ